MPETFFQDIMWCKFVFCLARLLLKRDNIPSNLRYFIIGNRSGGFYGITEREMDNATHMNDNNSPLWECNHLNKQECRRILKERLYV